ncbi:STAS domain-containing protein [Streptomyces griseus]|uniref:STAS domain-containing protein n=1 Tax=Streptomyces TaxID=1883 RepID=UPI0004CADB7C|nr:MULTISPECIES: STAS domain-containing protein [Streptomyces]MYT82022.1 STAS domain-containing protein [Streptomyces sp. SID8364]SBV07521.1 anti-anti-sigma factor [Streptomyces sp. MnatMP-M77]
MTTHPQHLRLTTVDTEGSIRIGLQGDLDYDSADHLLNEVTAHLAARPALTDLHLHCAELDTVDSTGLSVLLMISRRTSGAGVRLHLDARPERLDRLLHLTGTLDHFTALVPGGAVRSPATEESVAATRPNGPDGTT